MKILINVLYSFIVIFVILFFICIFLCILELKKIPIETPEVKSLHLAKSLYIIAASRPYKIDMIFYQTKNNKEYISGFKLIYMENGEIQSFYVFEEDLNVFHFCGDPRLRKFADFLEQNDGQKNSYENLKMAIVQLTN